MTRRELINRIRLYRQQLQLIETYQEDFLKIMSPSQLSVFIDTILDKMIEDRKALKKLDDNK